MTRSRDGAIARGQRGFDEGEDLAKLRVLITVPTEGRMPAGRRQRGPDEHALAPRLRGALGLLARLRWDIGAGGTPRRA